jgi:quercetin 2,3-dioxygenase
MKNKKIEKIISSKEVMMGPIKLHQPLPIAGLEQVDPFILLHHAGPKMQKPGKESAMDVGAHPHRGFEPVSFIFKGAIEHKDSRGNHSVINSGGVQWMTAGLGIVHSESAPKEFVDAGGEFEMIQLWINLPARLKMVQPKYQGFQKEEIPTFIDQDGKVKLNVISGEYKGLKGPMDSLTNITAYTLELKTGGKVSIDIPKEKNVMLYQLHGNTIVQDQEIGNKQLMQFSNKGEHIEIEAKDDSLILFLAGDPINEPVVSWGPYVMNSQTEIMEAMRDFQMGKMGVMV